MPAHMDPIVESPSGDCHDAQGGSADEVNNVPTKGSSEKSNLVADDLCRRGVAFEAQADAENDASQETVAAGGQSADIALRQPGDLSTRAAEVIQMVSGNEDDPESKLAEIEGKISRIGSATSQENQEIKIHARIYIGQDNEKEGRRGSAGDENLEKTLLPPIPRRERPSAVDFSTVGVLKRDTYTVRLSTVKSSPKWNLTTRPQVPAILDTPAVREEKKGACPAPWRYTLPHPDKTKAKAPSSSFGSGSSRFGRDDGPDKFLPGPGQYDSTSSTFTGSKWGFGSASRQKTESKTVVKPGPGAHDIRRTVGRKGMISMTGRPAESQLYKSWSCPGPGFYSPQTHEVERTAPQTSFGTASREMEKRRATGYDVKSKLCLPGPGAYDVHNVKKMGTTGVKHTIALRQYVSDVPSRYTPGPGSYNAHTTSFGY